LFPACKAVWPVASVTASPAGALGTASIFGSPRALYLTPWGSIAISASFGKSFNGMNTHHYLVDPNLQKIARALEGFTRTVVEIYVGALAAFADGFLIIAGAMFVILGVALPAQDLGALSASAVLLPLGLAWVFSRPFRRITWLFFGFTVLWMIVLTATLLPFLDIQGVQPFPIQILLAAAYLLPPLVATAIAVKSKKISDVVLNTTKR
jgi:hypothetical protein